MLEGNAIWRTATIFISSTFQDMQFERDCINTEVIPGLKEYFKPYRIAIRSIDLRWGINTIDNQEDDIESKIVAVCLDEIDRSRPFFVGIIGNRYGWIPSKSTSPEAKSVTEMELDYGALYGENGLANSIICIRNLESIPEKMHSVYYESDPLKQEKVKRLRERLRSLYEQSSFKGNLTDYEARWNEASDSLEGLSSFSLFLYESLRRQIMLRFNLNENDNEISEKCNFEILDSVFEEYIHACSTAYVNRSALEEKIIETINSRRLCCIYGESGNGKSALLSNLYYLMNNSSNIILYYNEALSTSLDKRLECLTFWDYKLSCLLGVPFVESSPDATHSQMFSRKIVARRDVQFRLTRLQDLSRQVNGKIICIVDGANDHIKWNFISLIYELLTDFFFVTSVSMESCDNLEGIYIPSFDSEEIVRYLDNQFKYHDKELHKTVVQTILEKVQYKNGNALWLSIMSYLLLNLNADDFDAINKNNGSEKDIEEYLNKLVEESPDSPSELFRYLYTKSVSHFNQCLITESLGYLSVSKNGLRDEDLERLLGDMWNLIDFAAFRRWFAPFMIESADNKRWTFSSVIFKECVKSLDYLKSECWETKLADLLWEYDFHDSLRYADLFYHLVNTGMYDKCGELIIGSDENYVDPIREIFEYRYSNDDIKGLVHNILLSLTPENQILAISKLLYLLIHNLFYNNFQMVCDITDDLLEFIDGGYEGLSEYALSSISAVLEDIILFANRKAKPQSVVKYSEILLRIALYRDSAYPSANTKSSISISAYNLATYYLSIGDIKRSDECFKLM